MMEVNAEKTQKRVPIAIEVITPVNQLNTKIRTPIRGNEMMTAARNPPKQDHSIAISFERRKRTLSEVAGGN